MRTSAIVLAATLFAGCTRPGLIGTTTSASTSTTSTGDQFPRCPGPERCVGGTGDSSVWVPIVLGTAVVAAVSLVMWRYVVDNDEN